ncbi:MAG: O-methyltransferase [Deltaproteobacteria bacterium]|nr:O-methyltransferase [Deltaproteobacteria bacterium]
MAVSMFHEGLDRYLEALIPQRPDEVARMEAYAAERRFPIIGPHVGRLLALFARATNARTVFEMGSGYGYSAYWFLTGMPAEGRIVLTDGDAGNRDRAASHLDTLGFAGRYDFRVGIGQEILAREPGSFDIVYNDIDKEQYPEVIDVALAKLRSGGLFITDNVLWSARVATDDAAPSTTAIRTFNDHLFARADAFSAIVPVRDGLAVAVKL